MDWKIMPPLSALRAFSAFAQTGSVVRAGAELNVTHAAISQQMRSLESHMGVSLLDRSARALTLTPEGQILAQAVSRGFGDIAGCIEQLSETEQNRPIHVTTTPSFAAFWLMPRLALFRAAHPLVNILIDPSPGLSDPAPGGVDVALRFGAGHWPGLTASLLIDAPVVVVAAPSLIGDRTITSAHDLIGLPWLREIGNHETSNWLARQGITDDIVGGITQVPGPLMLDGARAGQGVAVSTRAVVADDLRSGRLMILFQEPDASGYHIVTAPGVPRASVRAFLTWLRQVAV